MNPKKIFAAITDHNLDMQERVFRLIMTLGLIGLAIGIISGIIAGENLFNTVAIIIGFVILFFVTVFSVRKHHIQTGAVIVSAVIMYVVLPYNFFTTGGISGGAPIWMLLGVVYVCLVVRGRIKYIFLATDRKSVV